MKTLWRAVLHYWFRLSRTLETSLEFSCVFTRRASFFDRERVLRSTISNSKQYRLYCTKRDVLTWTSPRWASQPYIRKLLIETHDKQQLKCNYIGPLHGLTQLVVNRGRLGANWVPIGCQSYPNWHTIFRIDHGEIADWNNSSQRPRRNTLPSAIIYYTPISIFL